LSERTVRCICSEAKHSEEKSDESKSVLSFKSPRKGYKRAKIVSELDDFDSDVVNLKQKINYSGCLRSVRNLLKNLKFSYKKCNDGRIFLMERNDIVALRCKFLRDICTLRKVKDK